MLAMGSTDSPMPSKPRNTNLIMDSRVLAGSPTTSERASIIISMDLSFGGRE